jgi:hypothetical protein
VTAGEPLALTKKVPVLVSSPKVKFRLSVPVVVNCGTTWPGTVRFSFGLVAPSPVNGVVGDDTAMLMF